MTIADIKLRIAEEVAIHLHDPTTGKRIVPDTEDDADRIDRALRDGFSEFCDLRPWQFMRTIVELGVSPDGGVRYVAPSGMYMGLIDVKVPFANEGGGGSDADVVDAMTVRRHQLYQPSKSAAPTLLAIGKTVRLGANPSVAIDREGRGALEILIWPKPDQAYTALLETYLRPPLPVDPLARGVWFAVHDLTIVAFAARAFMRGGTSANAPAIGGIQERVVERVALSIQADDKLAEIHKPSPGTRSGRSARTGFAISSESQVILGG